MSCSLISPIRCQWHLLNVNLNLFSPLSPCIYFPWSALFSWSRKGRKWLFQICRPMDHNPASQDPQSPTPSTRAPDNHSNDLHSDWLASHCKGVIGSLPAYCNVMLNEDMWGPHSEPPASCQLCVVANGQNLVPVNTLDLLSRSSPRERWRKHCLQCPHKCLCRNACVFN